jgi:predicted nucleic acid-binding protein
MKYVLDASVALRVVLPTAVTPKAVRLRDDLRAGIHELMAPSIFMGEIASGLTKAERQKLIAVGDAATHLTRFMSWPPAMHP